MKAMISLFAAKVALGTAATLVVGVVAPAASYAASLTPVDLELWLGVDISGSVSTTEFNLQRQGYVNAFRSSGIQSLITQATNGIAVGYGYWATSPGIDVQWTLLKTAQDALDFADAIAATSRPNNRGNLTGIANAIRFGLAQIDSNDFDSANQVIDISGDGEENVLGLNALRNIRDAAAAAGVTINGLPIGGQSLTNYYTNNVITPDGFVEPAADFADFNAAITQKLTLEIGEVVPDPNPEPIPTPALLPGLIGMGAAALRKRGKGAEADA